MEILYEIYDCDGYCVASSSIFVPESSISEEIEEIIWDSFYPYDGDTIQWMPVKMIEKAQKDAERIFG